MPMSSFNFLRKFSLHIFPGLRGTLQSFPVAFIQAQGSTRVGHMAESAFGTRSAGTRAIIDTWPAPKTHTHIGGVRRCLVTVERPFLPPKKRSLWISSETWIVIIS